MDPQQRKAAAQFAPQAEKYARAASFQGGPDLEFALQVIAPRNDWQMLDVATGGGHTAFFFSPHVGSIIATDLTLEMLNAAKKVAGENGLSNITFQSAPAETLPFPDASFNLVTCRIAPHHFSDIDKFLHEARRVLIPGGTFLLIDGLSPDDIEAAIRYNKWERTRDPSHVRCLSNDEWMRRLNDAGFEVENHGEFKRPQQFAPYIERMSVPGPTAEQLRSELLTDPVLISWLCPVEEDSCLKFDITVGVYVSYR